MSTVLLTSPSEDLAEAALAENRNVECRVHERHSCGLLSQCQPASMFGKDDCKWSGTIHNISVGGVGLILKRRFEKGTGLAIELPGHGNKPAYVVLARVMHVGKHDANAWMLGCKFLSELSDDEVQRLLPGSRDSKTASNDLDNVPSTSLKTDAPKQHSPNFAKATTQILPVRLHLEIADDQTFTCAIRQFGTSKCSWPPAPGKTGTLQGVDQDGRKWKLAVQVRHCRTDGQRWNLECRLAKTLPEAELQRSLNALISQGKSLLG